MTTERDFDREDVRELVDESLADALEALSKLGDFEFFFGDQEEVAIELLAQRLNRPLTTDEEQRVREHFDAKGPTWKREAFADLIGKGIAAIGSFFDLSKDPGDANPLEVFIDHLYDPDPEESKMTELEWVAQGIIPPGQDGATAKKMLEDSRRAFEIGTGQIDDDAAVNRTLTAVEGMPPEVKELWIANGRQTDPFGRPILGEITNDGFLYSWDPDINQPVPFAPADEEERVEFIGGFTEEDLFPSNLGVLQRRQALATSDPQSVIPGTDLQPLDPADRAHAGRATGPQFIEYGPPQYVVGDQWTEFATKDPAYQTMVQEALASAGLLRESDIVPGHWTAEASAAMNRAMFEANITGGAKDWVEVLQDRAEGIAQRPAPPGPVRVRQRPRLVIPAYKKPDYAQLEVETKEAMRRMLNRDPQDWEIALLAEQLQQNYRKEYDAQAAALRKEWEAGNRVLDGGVAVAGTVDDVDPRSRLLQSIEEKYAAEIGLNEDRLAERQNVANVFNVLTQTQRVLGGGAF